MNYAELVSKRIKEATKRMKENTAYEERTDTNVDVLIDHARKLSEEIEEVYSPNNTPEEIEYIERLEMQLDRYLLAIKYS